MMNISITHLDHSESIPMELLLFADPSEEMIEKYLYSGESFLAKTADEVLGGFILQAISSTEIEIKNISVYPIHQRKGVGKAMIKYAVRYAKMEGYKYLVVKTADISTGQIAFYKKLKFKHEATVKGHFIKYYKDPVFENGSEANDQLIFRRDL